MNNKCGKSIWGLFFFIVLFGIETNAQDLKVYSGPYNPLKGGHVIYHYRDAPDGSRIFEGDFDFEKDGKLRINGQFKNNRQVGNWTWDYGNGYTANITFYDDECKFNFKGLWHTAQNYLKGTIRCRKIRKSFDVLADRWKLTSLDLYVSGCIIRMQWDSSGNPIGSGQAREDKNSQLYTLDATSGKWYYVQESTGDKIESKELRWLKSTLEQAEEWVLECLRPCIMRSTFLEE